MNHRDTPVLALDIRNLSGTHLLSVAQLSPGCIDLLAGCPPCQGYSRIRRRNKSRAVGDHRNGLVTEFGRLIKELRPRAVMMENVPGLENDLRFKRLLRSLRGMRYRVSWKVLDLGNFGVPQRRRRLVLLALKGAGRPVFDLIPTSGRRTVRDAIGALPRVPKALRNLQFYHTFRSKEVKQRIRSIPRNGGSRSDLPKGLTLQCHTEDRGFRDVYGRMAWDEPAPTITGGCINPSKGRYLHPERNRAITLLEAARLQGFPIWYRFDGNHGRYPIAEMIGEALPPRFAKVVAKWLIDQIRTASVRRISA